MMNIYGKINDNYKWANNEIIGTVVNNLKDKEAETTVFKIHYSEKYGTHIVPDYPSKKGKH